MTDAIYDGAPSLERHGFDCFNHHLVAADASKAAGGHVVVAMPPRGSLSRERALMFAAWLVTTADAAQGRQFDPAELAAQIAEAREMHAEGPNSLAYPDVLDGVTVQLRSFLTSHEARELASHLIASAHVASDLRPVFDRIAAVHAAATAALESALSDDRALFVETTHTVMRSRITPQGAAVEVEEEATAEEEAKRKARA